MKRQTGLRADPFLRAYVTTICQVLDPLTGRNTIDISAGTAWIRQLGFSTYTPVDVSGEHEYWDINTPLPEHHVGKYELAVCMGSLHYSLNPHESLTQILRTLVEGGDLVMMVPWMYPPHDRQIDRWRIAPQQIHSMVADHFDEVVIYNVGSMWQTPLHIIKRIVAGSFHGLSARQLGRLKGKQGVRGVRVRTADELPVRFGGPLNVVVHARRFNGITT